MRAVNLSEKLGLFTEHWSPKIVGELNDQYVKLAKFQGEFVWHKHVDEDEMFLVLHGTLVIHVREQGEERPVEVGEGEFFIVPRGMEHKPVADEEVHAILFEPKTVLNTGDVRNGFTLDELERI